MESQLVIRIEGRTQAADARKPGPRLLNRSEERTGANVMGAVARKCPDDFPPPPRWGINE